MFSLCAQKVEFFSSAGTNQKLPKIFPAIFAPSYQQYKLPVTEAEYPEEEMTFGSVVFVVQKNAFFGVEGSIPGSGQFFFFRFFFCFPAFSCQTKTYTPHQAQKTPLRETKKILNFFFDVQKRKKHQKIMFWTFFFC